MYKKQIPPTTNLTINEAYEGESIEKKIHRIVNNKEPIKDGAPLIYTERKEGVKAEMNIRTDRFELAIDAMDKVTKDKLASRDKRATDKERLAKQAREGMKKEGDSGAESVQATDN